MNLLDIQKIQTALKKDISRAFKKGDLQTTVDLLDCFADVTQRINNILRDDDIESYIKLISERFIDCDANIKQPDSKVVIFYDQIGTTICLGVQYLRGLYDIGYKVIYIYEGKYPISSSLFKEVIKYSHEHYIFDTKNVYDSDAFIGNKIRNCIVQYNPCAIIAHPQATGALGMSVLFSIKGINKIRIVPGDHHFYMGYNCFDRFIEFRPFGWSTAIYERNIASSQIYSLSYYPIVDEFVPYKGLPVETKGKIIIASGGATYKFQGSLFFYEVVARILSETKNTVLVFLGTPSQELVQMSAKIEFKDRIFLLGYRSDFVAIMEKIDILLNSIPFSGGLFCQTAANFSKPILSYSDNNVYEDNSVEDILGFDNKHRITHTSKDAFFSHAFKLINDIEFRKHWGKIAYNMLQKKAKFDSQLQLILEGKYATLEGIDVKYVDRAPRIDSYVNIRNANEPDYLMPLARTMKFKSFKYIAVVPLCILLNIKYIIRHILAVVLKNN